MPIKLLRGFQGFGIPFGMRKRVGLRIAAKLFWISLLLGSGSQVQCQSFGAFELIPVLAKNELWINPGLYSYHFDQSRDFNSANYGFGAEYRFSSVASLTAGTYRNSYYEQSNYVGAYWQPIAFGPINLGFVAGGFNGYANTHAGGWFPAILPAITWEGEQVGFNLLVIPTISSRVAGSLSLQLKIKAFQ